MLMVIRCINKPKNIILFLMTQRKTMDIKTANLFYQSPVFLCETDVISKTRKFLVFSVEVASGFGLVVPSHNRAQEPACW